MQSCLSLCQITLIDTIIYLFILRLGACQRTLPFLTAHICVVSSPVGRRGAGRGARGSSVV